MICLRWPKCLIAVIVVDVDVPYWTSKVEHIAAFTAIFSNICTAHAQKRLFTNFQCKFRHRRSIPRPRFLLECKISAIWWRFPLIFPFYIPNVSHISTSGLFDLLTEKVYHTSRHHVDYSHQVWSWYDHPLPTYSVFVCWYVTLPGDLDLSPFDLEQLSYMAGHVTNAATKFEDPTSIRSWVTSYNVSHWLLLKMHTRPLRMRRITWPVSRGWKTITFLESPTPICLFTIQLRWLYDKYY